MPLPAPARQLTPLRRRAHVLLLAGLWLCSPGLWAQPESASFEQGLAAEAAAPVAAPVICPNLKLEPWPIIEGDPADPRIHLQADQADVDGDRTTTFRGAVVIQRGTDQLQADEAVYHHSDETLEARGHVRLVREDLLIDGAEADLDMAGQSGEIRQARYRTADNKQGQAEHIRIEGARRMELQRATYTTCNPDNPDWLLSASRIDLNNETRQGTARNVVVEFQGVPFLYLPYMRFPVGDARLTGLLYPSIGTSDQHGNQVIVPFYWNIAPHRDATITANHMSKRGLMLQNEFRYLNPGNRGQLELDYLGDDQVFGADRERFRWEHSGQVAAGWSSLVDYNYVADTSHMLDFGGTLNASSLTHLNRRGQLSYNATTWQLNSVAQSYQVLSGSEVYQRLPQLTLNTRLPPRHNSLNYHFDSEWVRFAHRETRIEGDRLDLRPAVSLPLSGAAGFFIPRLELRYTGYNLDPDTTSGDTSLSRSVPLFSLDSGIFLERDTRLFGTDLLHTLEPRLFYVYVPYREQDDLPIFDSTYPGFNINNPFRLNRFDGGDRVGDTHHVTAALTSRLLDQYSGAELLMARIGQIFYLDERRVTLPGGAPETDNRSEILAEFAARPTPAWLLQSDLIWSPYTEEINRGTARLSYTRTEKLSLDLAYRYQRGLLETSEAGFTWQLNPRWRFNGRRLYDLEASRVLESVAGLGYDSCCWAINLEARERFLGVGLDNEKAIMLELDLKGLGSFGGR